MPNEILAFLNLRPGKIVLDCTVGYGGHAARILDNIIPDGRLIGVDWDKSALEQAKKNLADYNGNFSLICDNFSNLDKVLSRFKVKKLDACILDLGVSSAQLENPERGFSIKYDGPLDMRMDTSHGIDATRLINSLPEFELMKVIKELGEERFARAIARGIARERRREPIATTWKLAHIITRSIPARFRRRRIHPATRTFQALRIAVNKELDNLEHFLQILPQYLKKNARVCVISFHSLEDRIVKHTFRRYGKESVFNLLTKKPLTPTDEEIKLNPRARSAKLRVAEKI